MTPEEIQILLLAELPDVPVTTGRKPITDCTREDLAFAIDGHGHHAGDRPGLRPELAT